MNDDTLAGRAGLRPHLALVAVQLFFGTWPIVGKLVLRAMPATTLAAARVFGGAVAFLLLSRSLKRIAAARRSDYLRFALYSLLGVALNQLLFIKGLSLSTVINANLLGTMIPIFTLAGSVALGRESFSSRVALGLTVAALGAAYLVNPFGADFSQSSTTGNLLLVANAFFYGLYIAISQDAIRRYGAMAVLTWMFLMANVVTLPVGLYSLKDVQLANIGAHVWLALLYIVAVPTVLTYYLNAWALGRVEPSVVAVYIYLQPLIALAFAPLVLGERPGSRTFVAAALIFAGVGVVTIRRRSRVFEEVSERPDALGR
ncbi:MAG TPA: DMT family transporter [Pyrinomonadaceae bacterium]|nr:DMT family transporter [Pyrinomonadaceae bacterium]